MGFTMVLLPIQTLLLSGRSVTAKTYPTIFRQLSPVSDGGGMLTKTNIARKVADEGITVIIANGKRDNILVDLLQHPEETLCTCFIPSDEPVSSVKKWIAHSEGFAKGEIHINECATEVLNSEKAVSILPIGITHIEGEFEKDDIVRIMDFQGNQVGVGKVNCDSKQAQEAIGKHGKKPVVHYDYLYIE